jgi:hypothetical protein
MIDFRYHLVSLISVFLALAVGIALGAGPLKESIGDTLTGQVDQLRAEKEDLRAEADQLQGALNDSEAAITALSPSVMAGVLGGRRVALVVLDDVDPAVTSAVSAAIGQSGGSVTAVATVLPAWTDPTRTAFRQSLAGTMVSYLDQVPAADAGADVELADALVEGLTGAAPTDPDTLSENAGVLLDLLSGDAGLVSLANPVTTPADAVLLVAGPITPVDGEMATVEPTVTQTPSETPSETAATQGATESASPSTSLDAASRAAQLDAWTALATAAQQRSAGALVVTGEVSDNGLVDAIRSDEQLAGLLATVDGVRTPQGLLAVPLALADRIAGVVEQYGSGPQATAAMPDRTELPPIERVPAEPAVTTDPSANPSSDPSASAGTEG